MGFFELPSERAHGRVRHQALKYRHRAERGCEHRLMRAVVEIGQQERLRELTELDDAADDVLADAVEDAEAEAVLANNLEHNLLKL